MERNPEDSMIQERGCDTIHMIAKGKPADRKKAAGEQVARAVVAAMQRHTSSVHVQVSSVYIALAPLTPPLAAAVSIILSTHC